jgi:regulator of sigma E protease
MTTALSALAAFLGFAILIVLHELGHFAAAKKVGMRVERFSLFFGKPLWSVRRGETEYGIGWLPAGGYVKISGMNPNEELPPEVADRAYYRQPVWKRLVVIGAGPLVNLILAFLILAVLFFARGYSEQSQRIDKLTDRSPAQGILQPGDELLSVDGRRGEAGELREQIGKHRCAGNAKTAGCPAEEPAELLIRRDGREMTVSVTPRYDPAAKRSLVGFQFASKDIPNPSVGDASVKALDTMWYVTSRTVQTITKLFYSADARNEVSGVVGSYETTRRSFEIDIAGAIFILGFISLSLAVVNLFPFLPLDGGHIFWALVEKVRGRAVSFAVMERASIVGIVLVLMLFFIGLENDLYRISNDELGVR